MSFRPQDTRMFRPYPDEVPWELLRLADPSEERILDYADADLMRVAKYEDEAVGVYVVRPETPTRYEICNLAVAPAYRHKGLGRWLLGHAIGLAETKGAREIVVRRTPLRGLFRKTGFVEDDGGIRLELQPE
jgi:GNAT superfamily N-acetyltransferase